MKIKSKSIALLEEEAEVDMELRVDRTDIDSVNTPKIFNKYHKELRLVHTELIQHQAIMKSMWGKKWYYYMGKAHPDVYKNKPLNIKIMKSDVKMHIESDDDIIKLTVQIELLEMKKKYIETKMREINNRSYHIGNAIKTMTFKHGVN